MKLRTLLGVILFVVAVPLRAGDWPTWRFDARRSASSPAELPAKLHLHWTRHYPPEIPAWPEHESMPFDVCYEPIVVGRTLYLNSARHDCIRAIDTRSGERNWIFFAEGPIRFAPVAWEGRLYFSADDGYLYCIDGAKGTLIWKFRGGPSDRKILGNKRLISTWPARGAPVLVDGTVYFAASIWPFMGIFIHAVDARTGRALWTNDGEGSVYMLQPHFTESFASIAPQGPLVAIGDYLLLPGGRSVPACFDRKTGKFVSYQLAANAHKGGGSEVAAVGNVFFNGGGVFDIVSEKYQGALGKRVVLSAPQQVFTYLDGMCRAFDLTKPGNPTATSNLAGDWPPLELAALKTPVIESMIRAGNRLYAAGDDFILAIDIAPDGRKLEVAWQLPVNGTVVRLVAADDRLFAATKEGPIYAFGAEKIQPKVHVRAKAPAEPLDEWVTRAKRVLVTSGVRDGYCIVLGLGSGRLVSELLKQSQLRLLVLEPDDKKALELRRKFTLSDHYGIRLSIHHGDPRTFSFPPYIANLMVSEDTGILTDDSWANLYQSLRPYGGVACFFDHPRLKNLEQVLRDQAKVFVQAEVQRKDDLVLLRRVGPLPETANWTHEHADAGNTRVSRDKVVKAPLGILWFGGPSPVGILPRHGHGPQPQVIDGRMIVEGVDVIRAIDIYTGRPLWEAKLPGVGRFYNSVVEHQAGANASGSNYVSAKDGIYVAFHDTCVKLDPATGAELATFQLPPLPGPASSLWGYINVAGDFLVGGSDPLLDPKALLAKPPAATKGEQPPPKLLAKVLRLVKSVSDNLSASKSLVVMDRHTGQVLWSVAAKHGFRHNATCIGGNTLFTIDRLSGVQLAKLKAKKIEPEPARLLAFDLKTGKLLWSTPHLAPPLEKGGDGGVVFGTWLGFSEKHQVLVESGRVTRDALGDEPYGMRAYRAGNGQVLWFEKDHRGPPLIHGDSIIMEGGGCDLLTGKIKMRQDPLTGQSVPWQWARTYGCNTPGGSEHLLTFRSGAAGFFDLCNDSGTGNIGGFRSSCTNNLIVAGGVLTAPEYTRGCTCSYQNQTSLGLIHMPEAEQWTYQGNKEIQGPIKRLGLNLGAAGDRRAEDGTLWMETPSVAGMSPAFPVIMKPAKLELYRRHSSQVTGPYNWVTSSGVKGANEITVHLGKTAAVRKFKVRLFFAEPDGLAAGQRLFHVSLQGEQVLKNFDIAEAAQGPLRSVIKEFGNIAVLDTLTIHLTPVAEAPPVLSGIEVREEGD